MKSINLQFAKEKINGREMFFSTYELLKMAINNPTQGGIGVEEMGKRLRLLEKLETHREEFDIEEGKLTDALLERKGIFELEDADFDKLKSLFEETKWTIISSFIVKLSEEIKNAK
jgi:hypothetical protein